MRLVWLVMLLPLSGCLSFEGIEDHSADFSLEGHVVGASIWSTSATYVLDGPRIAEPAPEDPIGTPGMGDAHALSLPTEGRSVEVRAIDAEGRIAWYLVAIDRDAWQARHMGTSGDAWDQRGDAIATTTENHTVVLELPHIGVWAVLAEGTHGRADPFLVAVDVRWEVSGTVYPQRERSSPPPAGYDDMTDTYTVSLPTTLPGVAIRSESTDEIPYDEILTGGDIDVGLWGSDGTPITCVGSSSGDRAEESLLEPFYDVIVYDVSFAIGAMPDECGNGAWYYENERQVEYRAILETGYRHVLQ